MHPRRKIRDFVGAALNANQHIAPVVAVGEVIPIGAAKLPSVQVYTGREEVVDHYSDAPRIEKRVVDLRVELQVDATEAVRAQDVLDDLAEQVGISILADETQGDVAERTEYRETLPSATGEGDRVLVGLIVGFDVTYPFEYGLDDLPDFEGADVDIDIESETDPQIEAQAKIDT